MTSIYSSLTIIIMAFFFFCVLKLYFRMFAIKDIWSHECSKQNCIDILYLVKLMGSKCLLEIGHINILICILCRFLLEMLVLCLYIGYITLICGNCGYTASYPSNWFLISWLQQSNSSFNRGDCGAHLPLSTVHQVNLLLFLIAISRCIYKQV